MNNRVLKDSVGCLDFGDCICKGYDGAHNFKGHVKGMANRFTFKDNNNYH